MFEDQDGHFKVQRLHVRGAIREWLEKESYCKEKSIWAKKFGFNNQAKFR